MITSEKINQIQKKIKLALLEIEKSENVKIEFGSSRYNSAFYKTSMTVSTLEKTKAVVSVYESTCKRLGFTQNIIGMKFDNGVKGVYEVVDIKTKNRKYPVMAKAPNGIVYKFAVDYMKKLIGGDKAINRNANLNKLLGE